jgi:IclR family acetate operon transcriptional repressor
MMATCQPADVRVPVHGLHLGAERVADVNTAVGKALSVLSAFSADALELPLTEIAVRTGLAKSTVHRLLEQLAAWGAVERDPETGTWHLGIRMVEIAGLVQQRMRLRDVAQPYLEDLLQISQQTVHLAVLDHGEVLYIDKLVRHQSQPVVSRVGGRLQAHTSGLGKVLLAFASRDVVLAVLNRGLTASTRYTVVSPRLLVEELGRVREQGFAIDREETQLGVACLAAPIIDRPGHVAAAVSMTGPTHRFDPDTSRSRVLAAAKAISARLQRERSVH